MNSEVIGVSGRKKEHVEEAIERIVKPLLNECKRVDYNSQYALTPPTTPHYIQLKVDDDLLDPRRPNSPEQVALHYALAQSRKLHCTWILPATCPSFIRFGRTYDLRYRLDPRVYRQLSIAIEAAEDRATVYSFNTNTKQLYIYQEKVAQKQKRPKKVFNVYCPTCYNVVVEDGVGEHHDEWEEMYLCKHCNKHIFSCETADGLYVLERRPEKYVKT